MVKIEFNEENCRCCDAKAVLGTADSNGKNWAGFLTENEIDLLLSALKRVKEKKSQEKFITTETQTGTIILAILPDNPALLDVQTLGGKLYKKIKSYTCAKIWADLPDNIAFKASETAYNLAFGIELASYRFDKYLTKQKPEDFAQLEEVIFLSSKNDLDKNNYYSWSALANGVRYARDLSNEPANYMTPSVMAEDIRRLQYLGLEIEILDEAQMKESEFNLALSVAQGSCNPPFIGIMKWHGKENANTPQPVNYDLGLVGKGVTFDSGGISLKPGKGMWEMKQDMAGAAAVVGAMKTAALQKLPLNVVAVVGLVENMPSGSATRPGDIVRSMSGQTVEILNTDAEGRLVLADCLWYIQDKYKVRKVIDIATLTGAIVVTLGKQMAGLMSNSKPLTDLIMASGETVNEKSWPLPLTKEFDKMINSPIADMKNVDESRLAGSITAACFLQRFIQKEVDWAHLDIAGLELEEQGKPLTPKGASGFGVRLFNEIMKQL